MLVKKPHSHEVAVTVSAPSLLGIDTANVSELIIGSTAINK